MTIVNEIIFCLIFQVVALILLLLLTIANIIICFVLGKSIKRELESSVCVVLGKTFKSELESFNTHRQHEENEEELSSHTSFSWNEEEQTSGDEEVFWEDSYVHTTEDSGVDNWTLPSTPSQSRTSTPIEEIRIQNDVYTDEQPVTSPHSECCAEC